MIPMNTRPGSPVRVRWPRRTQKGDDGIERVLEEEREEETFTICRPFVLSAEAHGLDGIDAGTECVFLADMKIAPLKSVEARKGLHSAPGYRWGVFAEPPPRRFSPSREKKKKKKKGRR